jgi:hypothetical protein
MTYTELQAQIIRAIEAESLLHWSVGDLLAQSLPNTRGAAKALAADIGKSGSWVSDHQKTAKAFPEEHRAPDMPWSVFVECARTTDPVWWLDKAIEGQWSTRQLKEALTEAGARNVRASKRSPTTEKTHNLELDKIEALLVLHRNDGGTHYIDCCYDHPLCAAWALFDLVKEAG